MGRPFQLGRTGQKLGTTTVSVDAPSSAGIVTAVQGSGPSDRDAQVITPSTAQADAIAAAGGGSAFHPTLANGGRWRWDRVFLRNAGGTKDTVGVSAITGVVTPITTN